MTTTERQMRDLTERVIRDALTEARARAITDAWSSMEAHMAERLPRLCRDAVIAALRR